MRKWLQTTVHPYWELVVGRLVYVDIATRMWGTVALYCGYLDGSVGLSGNSNLIATLGSHIRSRGLPYVAGAGWNLDPHVIQEALGRATCGRIVYDRDLEAWTCKVTADAPGTIRDYFVLADSLAHAILQVLVLKHSSIATHRPQLMELMGGLNQVWATVAIEPKMVPAQHPITARREPLSWDAVRAAGQRVLAQAGGD